MLLDNNKIMLIYGFNEEEKESLQGMITDSELPNKREITSSMINMKIRDIVEGLNIETYEKQEFMVNEKLILFNNFSDEEIEKTIDYIKHNFLFNPIFAVVTEMSNEWIFKDLLSHLVEEREWYKTHNM